ncbi:MAG TPA: M20/M25/M40 family metallo-hydrolase [Gemmatimonadales bacterium]|nr:M20/M25/M40 family metallo-hydrolase [Gemmatimonadales bacterium]
MTTIRAFGTMAALALAAAPLAAQMQSGPATVTRAAATITEADVARRINIIAHDSMMGRDTPSRGLELTAQYIADEFKRLGLKPGGENGTFFQRYPITSSQLDVAASHVGFMYGGKHVHAEFAKDARRSAGPVPASEIGGAAVLVAGPVEARAIDSAAIRDKVVLWVMDFTKPTPPSANAVGPALIAAGARAIITVSNRDSTVFAQRLAGQMRPRTTLGDGNTGPITVPVIEVHERAMAEMFTTAGTSAAEARASTAAIIRPLEGVRVMVDMKETKKEATAPNTIGILEGSDPTLRNEYIVYSAHMDHDGIKSPLTGTTDSIWNGADDDASGTVGIVELAEAFAQQGARPKRSIIFMTVSGEEKGLWGSRWFSDHPTVPLAGIVANLNLDMIGRNSGKSKGDVKQWSDTIVVIGKEHSDLGTTLNRVNAAHPELRMNAIDDIWPEERFYFRSDHYNFARKGVPILFFFNGTHEDYHQPTDTPDKIDAEKESRVLQLLYFLGQDIGNAAERPQWKPESYKEIVEQPTS